jgi:hypothetical protein
MKESFDSSAPAVSNERGAARLKLIVVLAVVGLVGYMGFQYIPVAYQSHTFKKLMDSNTMNADANGTLPTEQKGPRVEQQLRASASEYGVPPNAKITHTYQNGQLQVTVQFTRPINLLPGLTYNYDFSHTSKSNPLLQTQ